MITRKEINLNTPLSEAQIEMLSTLAATPAVPDEDCPELTLEQLAKFKRISEANRESRCKQTVTLRLSPQAMRRAKSLGKGYTSVLSRIVENALLDPATIQKKPVKIAHQRNPSGASYLLYAQYLRYI